VRDSYGVTALERIKLLSGFAVGKRFACCYKKYFAYCGGPQLTFFKYEQHMFWDD